jgi:hypothetical protein
MSAEVARTPARARELLLLHTTWQTLERAMRAHFPGASDRFVAERTELAVAHVLRMKCQPRNGR